MFEYTTTVIKQTIDDVKKISRIANFATQGIYVAYLIFAICSSIGFLFVNIPLLVISVAYLIFTIVMECKKQSKNAGEIKNTAKKIFAASKYIILIPTLITSFITLTTLEGDNITFPFLFAIMMVFGYFISIILMAVSKVVEDRMTMFKVAFMADIEPIVNVYNGIRKFKGERVEESTPGKAEQKIRAELDSKIDMQRSVPKPKNQPEMMSEEEIKAVRKEMIHSIASNIGNKAKQKFDKVKSKLADLLTKPLDNPAAIEPPKSDPNVKEDIIDDLAPIEK